MKSKLTVPKRNPFVCLVLKKTGAGSHRKPNKAMRRQEKQSGYNSIGQSSRLLPDLSEFKSLCPDHVTILKYITMLFRGSDHRKERVVYFNMVVYTINTGCQGYDR